MGTKKARYSAEFITLIVELYRKRNTASEIIIEYGINKTTLHKWINDTQEIRVVNEQISAVEVKKLKSRIKELEEENDILKKAVAIFTKK